MRGLGLILSVLCQEITGGWRDCAEQNGSCSPSIYLSVVLRRPLLLSASVFHSHTNPFLFFYYRSPAFCHRVHLSLSAANESRWGFSATADSFLSARYQGPNCLLLPYQHSKGKKKKRNRKKERGRKKSQNRHCIYLYFLSGVWFEATLNKAGSRTEVYFENTVPFVTRASSNQFILGRKSAINKEVFLKHQGFHFTYNCPAAATV